MSLSGKKSLKGYFLAANTTLAGSYFSESVILMLGHDHRGALGLVLNKPDPKKEVVYQLLNSLSHDQANNMPVYEGGPVDERSIFMLHSDSTMRNPGEEVLPGIFWGSSVELFQELIASPLPFNVYRGHSGWAAGQLEREIQSKSWIVLPPSDEIIFHSEPNLIWRKALSANGGLYSYFAEKVRDPILN